MTSKVYDKIKIYNPLIGWDEGRLKKRSHIKKRIKDAHEFPINDRVFFKVLIRYIL
jgi:hypothetical protein